MNLISIIDKLSSIFLILILYLITLISWKLIFSSEILGALVFFPFGILILGFLFFGNKIIFSVISGQFFFFLICLKYDLNLYYQNYFIWSIIYTITVPLTLLIMNKFTIKIGVGSNYKLDKTNICHVLLITLFSSIIFFFLSLFFSIFYNFNLNSYFYTFGNFIGGSILILIIKFITYILILKKKL